MIGQAPESMSSPQCGLIESMGMRIASPLALVLLLTLALAACGSSGSGSASSGGGTKEGASSSQPCAKGTVVVHMRNIRFAPATIAAKAGQSVCWVNDDDVQHDAQAQDGQFSSVLFGKGKTYTTKLAKAGTIAYVCSVHPGMTGTLKVSP
jgi:plastocyanin